MTHTVRLTVEVEVSMSEEALEAFAAEQGYPFDDLNALDAAREAVQNGLKADRRLRHRFDAYTGLKVMNVRAARNTAQPSAACADAEKED